MCGRPPRKKIAEKGIRMSGKWMLALIASLWLGAGVFAADSGRIELPAPAKSGGPTLTQVLSDRQSSREFADVDLTPQQLSDLLWATAGVNRPDGKKTYPVARGRQDMLVFVFIRSGVYRYDPAANVLVPVAAGDQRVAAGKQPFVGGAAVNLAFVQDMSLWPEPDQAERGREWGFAHTGAMMQNAYLYAAGQGWSAVVRGMFDQDGLKKLLKLSDTQFVRLVHSIGPGK